MKVYKLGSPDCVLVLRPTKSGAIGGPKRRVGPTDIPLCRPLALVLLRIS